MLGRVKNNQKGSRGKVRLNEEQMQEVDMLKYLGVSDGMGEEVAYFVLEGKEV